MALHSIHEDGTLHWRCLGLAAKCQNPITIHVSHEGVQWHPIDGGFVVMPPCSKCGAQMTVKVSFSEEDLAADNALQYGMIPQAMTVPHAITGDSPRHDSCPDANRCKSSHSQTPKTCRTDGATRKSKASTSTRGTAR